MIRLSFLGNTGRSVSRLHIVASSSLD
jgi:hypothetical protein